MLFLDALAVIGAERFMRGPGLAFPAHILAFVLAHRAVFGGLVGLGVLGAAGAANEFGHVRLSGFEVASGSFRAARAFLVPSAAFPYEIIHGRSVENMAKSSNIIHP